MSETCVNCKFFEKPKLPPGASYESLPENLRVRGYCKRMPPTYVAGPAGINGQYAIVTESDWCGEFRDRAG